MLIVQLHSGQNSSTGDFIYRIEQPARWLSKLEGVEVVNIDLLNVSDWTPLIKAPLLILHHLSDPDLLPIIKKRREFGLPTIYELADNFHASQEHLCEDKQTAPPEYHVIIEALMKRCDGVQTTGSDLRQGYEDLNSHFLIFPNLVEDVNQPKSPDKDSGTFTFGWGGSVRHLADLEAYVPALTDWVIQHSDVRLGIMASQKIHRLFSRVPSAQLFLYHPGSLNDYLAFLSGLDAGIAPLLPTAFNACRSDVKFLEYASCEAVPLSSRFGPYLEVGQEDETILFFDNGRELITKLESLRKDREKRTMIAKQARRWVEENRLASKHDWQGRIEKYKSFFPECPKLDVSSTLEELQRTRDLALATNLLKGIESRSVQDSISILSQAVRDYPHHYQAHYFYGWAQSRVGNYEES
ncbi:glycosyltransferase, partial [candidate division KSB1 bacterium]|nr:glycosyltransferase [candidate division KSB1 bacterium]